MAIADRPPAKARPQSRSSSSSGPAPPRQEAIKRMREIFEKGRFGTANQALERNNEADLKRRRNFKGAGGRKVSFSEAGPQRFNIAT